MKKCIFLFSLFLIVNLTFAQLKPQTVSIPMRDGKTLAGDLYLPNTVDSFPTIVIMTPYGKVFYKFSGLPFGIGKDMSKSKYAILIVDWRCRFASLSACSVGSSNGEDGYDVVEWTAKQKWCTGKIGTWGPSALGNVQFNIAKEKPPHLVCAVPEVAAPIFLHEKYHPGGAMEAATFKTLNEKLFPGSYDLVIKNPYYNLIWKSVEQNSTYLDQIEVPMLLIGGWYDHNIKQNLKIMKLFETQAPLSVRDKHKILIGPWVHGGTGQASLGTSFQGDFSFPNATKWNDSFSMVFFDYYLRGINNGYNSHSKYTYYQIGENIWESSNSWPPIAPSYKTFYLGNSNDLTEIKPNVSGLSSKYIYDPEDPSPTVGGKTLSDDLNQGPYDQAPLVESRKDVLLFTSKKLLSDLIVLGSVKVNLNVSSDREDTDFVVRVTEVFPDGKSIQVGTMIQRMRFRGGYEKKDTQFMRKGIVYPITIALEDVAYTFSKGNSIRLIVSSSNYPLYNRNMNNGGEMYPGNKVDSLENPMVATNEIHYGSDYISSVELPNIIRLDNIEKEIREEIVLYPNPVIKNILVSIEGSYKYKITDLSGKVVLESRNFDSKNHLDVGVLKTGLYHLVLEDSKGRIYHSKFIKQ